MIAKLFDSIRMYYCLEKICLDTTECFRGRAPNRHRLFLGMVHAYRHMKGEDPMHPDLIYLTKNQWIKAIERVAIMYPHLKLFYSFCRSGGFGSMNELAENGMVYKVRDPNNKTGYLYAINTEYLKCAGCVKHNMKT